MSFSNFLSLEKNDRHRGKRKRRQSTLPRPFQSTGQVVACRERTQNTDRILHLQPPFQPFSTYISTLLLLFHSNSCLNHPCSISLYQLLPHRSSALTSHTNRRPLSFIYTQQTLYGEGLQLQVKTMPGCLNHTAHPMTQTPAFLYQC